VLLMLLALATTPCQVVSTRLMKQGPGGSLINAEGDTMLSGRKLLVRVNKRAAPAAAGADTATAAAAAGLQLQQKQMSSDSSSVGKAGCACR
jgi:hypothetical protein